MAQPKEHAEILKDCEAQHEAWEKSEAKRQNQAAIHQGAVNKALREAGIPREEFNRGISRKQGPLFNE